MEGTEALAELNPAFAYHGIKMKYACSIPTRRHGDRCIEPQLEEKDQFAAEMDHFALCVAEESAAAYPGEEGLQDQRITDAIYESARTGRTVRLAPPAAPTRGPDPQQGL